MKKQYQLGGVTLLASLTQLALFIDSASAGLLPKLLEVDLSVVNQITITSTTEASLATVSGHNVIGVYLDGFYGSSAGGSLLSTGSGDLTSFLNIPDNSLGLFRASGDPGLNIWSFTNDLANFEAGTQAFKGQATWALTPDDYAAMLGGPEFGALYFPADDIGDVASATLIGEWALVSVSAPEPLTLMGASAAVAFGVAFKRKRKG